MQNVWLGGGADEKMYVTGLERQMYNTIFTVRVLPTPRTQSRAEREEHDVSCSRFCVMGREVGEV